MPLVEKIHTIMGLFLPASVFTYTREGEGGFMTTEQESPPAIHQSNIDETIIWVMEEYGESLKRFIFTYVKSRSQTDDIFQEVLLVIYHKIDTFQGKSSFKTWLYRITANKCKDYLRSPVHRVISLKDQFKERESDQTPESSLIEVERKHELIDAIMALPIKYREVLILQYYKEFSIKEMSELLKVNSSTVKTRIMRAKDKLKQSLKEDYLDE
ncbi:sigma-70 family RNA polymerase sigma factor [Virgibacillus kekensis]|uniref:Sigma-70 family RNA polymerase sigma factor n=1 Tax=Virgibacillus kekensis TaxID=202261 RepID=A0ABV9DJ40_9BACI